MAAFLKRLDFLILSSVLTSFALLVCLSFYFMHYLPSIPQPEVGRIYRYSEHGRVVYLNYREQLLYEIDSWCVFVTLPFLVIFHICSAKWRR